MGHVALGHARKRMIDFSGQNALRTALAMILSRFLPGIGVFIANGLTSLLAARMSRGDEYEADEYAAALLIKAGIGTGPQKALFEKLEAGAFRLSDHRFEWTRAESQDWANKVSNTYSYEVQMKPIGEVHPELGAPSQMAIFTMKK